MNGAAPEGGAAREATRVGAPARAAVPQANKVAAVTGGSAGIGQAICEQLLAEGTMLPHEPAFDPDPADYETWEYCRGYADGVRASRPWRMPRR